MIDFTKAKHYENPYNYFNIILEHLDEIPEIIRKIKKRVSKFLHS